MKLITPYATLIYVAIVIIATAGSIYHGIEASEHIFTVAGVLNFIFGAWTTYNVWRKEENDYMTKNEKEYKEDEEASKKRNR